ncbi:MAG: CinA family nicotinamide mononucleotide deamidase-related protein, partial [Candidatus Lindowbacteria bacterium]|nr:CinA family nicotinamide mononucleotide deamidase-related protein [Candidatus Lindowbacteria bacterium]
MNAEIIMIGSELLLGQIIDTNAAYLAGQLAGAGINLFYKTTIGDNWGRMAEVIGTAMKRSDIVITSGGLGPTEDDLTREVVAEVVGQPLEFRQGLFDQIEGLFKRHGYTMSPNNRKQAFIPRAAIAIENPVGTAPGFVAEKDGKVIVTLPGVPRELKFLTERFVIPFLRKKFSLGEVTIASRVLKICGMGESKVDARVGDLIRGSSNPTLGILAEPAQILLRITAKASTSLEAQAKISDMEVEIRRRLGALIFGADGDTLEGVVNTLLTQENKSLAVLETLTGGGIAQRFASIGSHALIEAAV